MITLIATVALGQLNNRMFDQPDTPVAQDSSKLKLHINGLLFNKNNEYFGKIADGFTLFGYQVNPSLSYQPTPNTRLDAGVYAQKDFGNDDYTQIAPTLTFTYESHLGRLLLGTLEGATSHRLIEPLMDFEKVLVDRLENGLQFKVENERLFLDAWLDWQNMLYRGEDDQEALTGGLSVDYALMDGDRWNISLPVQLVVKHLGGQIDLSPLPLQTYTNTAIGLSVARTALNGFVEQVRFDGYYVAYNDFSFEYLRPFQDGDGIYLNATANMKKGLELMLSYWRGNEYLTIQGGQLYPSESTTVKNPFHLEESRELLIMRLFHNVKLADKLTLSSRFEPYYDLGNSRFEFSHAMYLNYRLDFDLLTYNAPDDL